MTAYRFTLFISLFLLPCFARANDFYITLRNEKISVPGFLHRVVDIVDAREQTYCIGIVQRGMGNKKVAAFFKDGLKAEFGYLFANSFAADAQSKPLVLRINKLQVYEITYSNREMGIVELSISLLEKEDDHHVEIYETGVTVERKSLMDVTSAHDANIAQALQNCLVDFVDREQRGLTYRRPANENPVYPVLQETILKPGIFRTFNDFRDNAAQEDPAFPYTLEVWGSRKNDIVQASVKWKGSIPVTEIWGVSDGQYAYINLGNGFFRLTKENDAFVLFGPSPRDGTGAVMLGAAMGGIIGGLIAGAISGGYSSRDMTKYKIDLSTGAMVPFEEPAYRRIESRLLLFSSGFNAGDSRISVTVDGQPIGDMPPGTYHRLRLPPPEKAIEICASVPGGEKVCETVTPELFKTSVALLRIRKGKAEIGWPGGDIRSGLLNDIKTGGYKPLKEGK